MCCRRAARWAGGVVEVGLQYHRWLTKHAPTGRCLLQHHITKGGENHDEAFAALRPLRRLAACHRRLYWLSQLDPSDAVPRHERIQVPTMFKLTLSYARYAASLLATVGFGTSVN